MDDNPPMNQCVIVLGGSYKGKSIFVVRVSEDLKGIIHAGTIAEVIGVLMGGNGGGSDFKGQGGSKDITKIDYALSKICDIIKIIMDYNWKHGLIKRIDGNLPNKPR